MTLSLTIAPEIEAKLREQAAATGEPLDAYASRVLADAIRAPSIDELLAPVRLDFLNTGMSDEQIIELGRKELESIRAEKAR